MLPVGQLDVLEKARALFAWYAIPVLPLVLCEALGCPLRAACPCYVCIPSALRSLDAFCPMLFARKALPSES